MCYVCCKQTVAANHKETHIKKKYPYMEHALFIDHYITKGDKQVGHKRIGGYPTWSTANTDSINDKRPYKIHRKYKTSYRHKSASTNSPLSVTRLRSSNLLSSVLFGPRTARMNSPVVAETSDALKFQRLMRVLVFVENVMPI